MCTNFHMTWTELDIRWLGAVPDVVNRNNLN